jgi:hypothetical protein
MANPIMTTVLARTSDVPFDAELFPDAATIESRKYGIAEIDARNSLYADEHLSSLAWRAFSGRFRRACRA